MPLLMQSLSDIEQTCKYYYESRVFSFLEKLVDALTSIAKQEIRIDFEPSRSLE
jgi:hypothetical protein